MATSNSTDWSLNRDQVITAALRKLMVLSSGGTPTAAQISDAADSLNALVKNLQADGMPLWKISSTSFTVADGTASYTAGPSQTINCPKPLRVLYATYTVSGGTTTPMRVITRQEYHDLPKNATTPEGAPTLLYYEPGRATGTVYLWPIPDNSTTSVALHYQSPYEDMDSASNDFDFPSEWIMPLIYLLAWTLAPEYGIPVMDRQEIKKDAEFWHTKALSMGSEEGSVYIQPDRMQ